MVNPCPGHTVTTPFGKPGSWAAGYHTGEDYACPTGTPVVAAAAGAVVADTWNDDYGNYVEIETSGIRHRYCHLREPGLVTNGMHVGAGQMIGYAGSTGNSTGPHLHYEERTPPSFGYWDHRRPEFNHAGTTEEDDMPSPKDVWEYPITNHEGDDYSAETFMAEILREIQALRAELKG